MSAAWVRIGDIAERALADGDQAVEAYRNALLAAPDELAALAGLVRGLTRRRDFAEAAIVLRRLATVESEPEARVGHLVTLGELLAGPAEDPEGAADAFEQALALDPHHDLAIDRLDAILVRLGEPSRLAAALGTLSGGRARRAGAAAAAGGALERPARIERAGHRRAAHRGRHRMTDDVEARTELGRVLEAADRLPEAIAEHLVLLRLEPLRVASLQALRRLCERAGQRRRAARVAAALAALGLTDAADARAVREARQRWTPEMTGAISGADFESILRHPDARHPATLLLAAMSEVLPRLYGLALEDWGVSKQDRLAPRSEDPQRAWSAASPRCSASRTRSTSSRRAPSPPRSRSRPARRRRCCCRRTLPRCRGKRPTCSWAGSSDICAPGPTRSGASRGRIWASWSPPASAPSSPTTAAASFPRSS